MKTNTDKLLLLPYPKKVEWSYGMFKLPTPFTFSSITADIKIIKKICKNRLKTEAVANSNSTIKFLFHKDIKSQSYRLIINPNQMTIEYSDEVGLFYALITIKQLADKRDNRLPCGLIEDSPDLKTRGVMLDISRGKVPTLETLYKVVDLLSDLKYNHLQLYIEGFSFGYPSFKHLWENTEILIKPNEFRQLDAYCKDNYIELVPNQNSLGHMGAWLATEEYKDLAECPEGYKLFGLLDVKTTLAPSNPNSLALVKKMSEDLLPCFSSDKFNVNLDEPFELGKCEINKKTDPKAVTQMYLYYAKKLNEYVNSKGKTMMMWGDVVSQIPESIHEIPKNIILLEWRYEGGQSFEHISQKYKKAGLKYMVCPGTSTWSSFSGRTDNMIKNIENAVNNGIKYGADGMLITDWGNTPHLQYLTVSYAGWVYGAALSWNYASKDQIGLDDYLSQSVFKDKTNQMGKLVLDLGRYYHFEEYPIASMTTTSLSYMFGIMDNNILSAINKKMQSGILEYLPDDDGFKSYLEERFNDPKVYDAKSILHLMDSLEAILNTVHLDLTDASLIIDEYKNTIKMVRLGAKLKQYNICRSQQTDTKNKEILTEINALCTIIQTEHRRLWLSRNKSGGLEASLDQVHKIQIQSQEQLALLN